MSIAQKILANPSAYSIEMLTQGVKDGVIPAYIGIPLIQQKTQEKSQAAGMQGAQQGKQPPIAEEVLAKAQQAGGVDQLPSNLPTQGYAHGGIVAFAGGGNTDEHGVQHFEEGGTPFGRWYNQTKANPNQETNFLFLPGLELGSPAPHSYTLTTRLLGSSIIGYDFILQSLLKKLADFLIWQFTKQKRSIFAAKTLFYRKKL